MSAKEQDVSCASYIDAIHEMEIYGPIDSEKLLSIWSDTFQREFAPINPDIKFFCSDETEKKSFKDAGIYRFSFKRRGGIAERNVSLFDACSSKDELAPQWFFAGVTGLMLAWYEIDRIQMKGHKICSPHMRARRMPVIDFTFKKPLIYLAESAAGLSEAYDLRFSKAP